MQRIPFFRANFTRVVNRLQRNLKLQHDAVHSLQQIGGRIHIRRLQQIVRALHHEDPVLPVGLDKDRRYPAGDSLHLLDVRSINSQAS